MNVTQQKINQAREKSLEWIEFLATKSDKDLQRRLETNHLQYAIAVKEKKEDVCELLSIMERIIIEARIYKAENKIATVPSEIELAIAHIETFTAKDEKRQEIVNESSDPNRPVRSRKTIEPNNDIQLELF